MNPHVLADTSPSSWRVCLFRHSDLPAAMVNGEGQTTAPDRGGRRPAKGSDDLPDLGKVAGDRVALAPVDELGLLSGANLLGLPATGPEPAA